MPFSIERLFCLAFPQYRDFPPFVGINGESPRLWSFENRLKLLGIVTLVYAFLLHLLNSAYSDLVQSVLRFKCHRTGKRCREVLAPLYRLRWAISRLWDDYHPALGSVFSPNLETLQVLASKRC